MNIAQGKELALIEAWSEPYDEIDELKKLFLEFLRRWVENDGREKENINAPIIYERKLNPREPFSLSTS